MTVTEKNEYKKTNDCEGKKPNSTTFKVALN